MTYTELARIRSINKESAIRLARRERWRKLPGNDQGGTVRVFVPEDWLKPAREDPSPAHPTPIREGIPEDLRQLTAGWEQASARSARVSAFSARASAACARIRDRTIALTVVLPKPALRAFRNGSPTSKRICERRTLTQQRILTEQARQQASEQEQAAQAALQAAHELRRAEEARRARGRLRRILTAWRGE
jgi:hypothetical protein